MLESINALFVTTKNMGPLIEFYKTLGVPLRVSDHGGGQHAEAQFGNVHFAIQPWTQTEKPTSNIRFAFNVPNLEAYCRELEGKGLRLQSQPTPSPFGGVTAEITDPDGNHIILMRWQTEEEYDKNFAKEK